MSLILGRLEDGDCVIACEGQGGEPDWDENVLKTVRLTPTMVLGCTGDTDFMRPVLAALGFEGVERSKDTRLFWDIEESDQLLEIDHDQAWARVDGVVSPNAELYANHKDGLAVALIARRGNKRYGSVWSAENHWNPQAPAIVPPHGLMEAYIGYLPGGVSEHVVWEKVSEGRGATCLEDRLAEAIRWCAAQQADGERKINGNVFTRRMSEEFRLRSFPTPRSLPEQH